MNNQPTNTRPNTRATARAVAARANATVAVNVTVTVNANANATAVNPQQNQNPPNNQQQNQNANNAANNAGATATANAGVVALPPNVNHAPTGTRRTLIHHNRRVLSYVGTKNDQGQRHGVGTAHFSPVSYYCGEVCVLFTFHTLFLMFSHVFEIFCMGAKKTDQTNTKNQPPYKKIFNLHTKKPKTNQYISGKMM